MEEFEFQKIELSPETLIIKLPAKLLGGVISTKFTEVIEQVKQGSFKNVLLDMSDIEVINSLGLGMIVASYTSLKKNSKNLVLVSPSEKVVNLLKITHLDTIFKVFSSIEEFIATQ